MTHHDDQDLLADIGMVPAQAPAAPSTREGGRARRRRDDQEARRARARRRRLRALVSLVVIAVLVAGTAWIGKVALTKVAGARPASTAVADYPGPGGAQVVVTVPEGATGQQIGEVLKEADVVATVSAFVDAYNANANSGNIQAGTYTLRTQMSAAGAVAALLDPASKSDHTLTVPEGYTKDQVKERLVSVGGFSEEEVEAAYADAAATGLPAAANGDVEGWLAPSTYDVPEDATATDVVSSMVSTTLRRLQKAGVAEADYETVLTKASVIEREANLVQYYAQVARVIDNRLEDTDGDTKGRLQMDSTVLYGLGRTGGIPTQEEVADASNPYNTYQHAGLPPTPIGSPSVEALTAAVNPAQGSWLYFVTVDLRTGETLFASTYAEHQRNTERLTEYCKENPDVCSSGSASASPTQGS